MSTPNGTGGELLRLTDVSKSYRRGPQELCVLREVSLEVRAGQLVCVEATHSGGKTTLLRLAAGIDSADAGVVSFEGQDLAACSDRELSRLLGERIAWASTRGPRTGVQMFDYIAMPLLARGGEGAHGEGWIRRWLERRAYRRTVPARVQAALERVGAAGCAKAQWDTMSDWERALCELAHAIAGDPDVLLLDDVTDNLGAVETRDFVNLVRAISKERALGVLMSVSDSHVTILSDRIMRLSGGRLTQAPRGAVTQGPPPSGGNVFEFPGGAVGSGHLEAGHASSS
jgi:ABC-type cobalamin/Fe3+-siderophores transport system ATPase subunit